jgi:hypothetical protein
MQHGYSVMQAAAWRRRGYSQREKREREAIWKAAARKQPPLLRDCQTTRADLGYYRPLAVGPPPQKKLVRRMSPVITGLWAWRGAFADLRGADSRVAAPCACACCSASKGRREKKKKKSDVSKWVLFLEAEEIFARFFFMAFLNSPCHETPKKRD